MLDKCAYIIHNMKEKAMKGIDPYGEEEWTEEERNKILGIEPEKPKKDIGFARVEKPKKVKVFDIEYEGENELIREIEKSKKKKKAEKSNVKGPEGYYMAGVYHPWSEIPLGDEQLEDEEIPNEDEQNLKEQLIRSQNVKVIQKLEREFNEDELIDMNYETLVEIIDDIKQEMEENDRWWYEESPKKDKKKIEPIPDLSGSMKSAEQHWKNFEKTYVKKAKDFEERSGDENYYMKQSYKECPNCEGRGRISLNMHITTCPDCGGTGRQIYQKVVPKPEIVTPKKTKPESKKTPKPYTRSDIEFDQHHETPKAKKAKTTPKDKEIECYSCKGWGHTDDGVCYRCGGTGRIKVDKDYKGPTWSIGGASDYSYGS